MANGEAALAVSGGRGVVLERRDDRGALAVEVGDDGPAAGGGDVEAVDRADGDVFGARGADLEVGQRLAGERAQVLHAAGLEARDDDGTVDGDVHGDAGDAVEQHDVGRLLGTGCPSGNGQERGSESCGTCEDLLHRMVLSDVCDHGTFPPSGISTVPTRSWMTPFPVKSNSSP